MEVARNTEKISKEAAQVDGEKWVHDSSFDHKGKPPARASTGAWKAALFITAIEFGERLSYFGLATNLIIYLTKVLHEDVKTAAKNVNFWSGVTTVVPLVGGLVADNSLRRFSTVVVSAPISLVGLSLLTMSGLFPTLKPCSTDAPCQHSQRKHEVFFITMYFMSIGTGGHKPTRQGFGADQFDDDHTEEKRKKLSYFNWWKCSLCRGLLLGVTIVVYVQDNVNWATADIVLTVVMISLC